MDQFIFVLFMHCFDVITLLSRVVQLVNLTENHSYRNRCLWPDYFMTYDGLSFRFVSKPACIGSRVIGAVFFLQFVTLLENEFWPLMREVESAGLYEITVS